MSQRRGRRVCAALVSALAMAIAGGGLLGACSDDGDGDGDDGGTTSTSGETTTTVDITEPLAESPPGTGVIALGSQLNEFEITTCRPTLPPGAPPEARPLFELEGSGTGRGGAFTVIVSRYESEGEEQTFTDTILYQDQARIYRAQRFEVDGVVSDLRDPSARSPLLAIDGDRVVASGNAGPPGDESDPGVPIRLDATCAPA